MDFTIHKLEDILDLVVWNEEDSFVIINSPNINYHLDYINEADSESDFSEGTLKRVYTNKYERNPKLRQSCINYYGYNCQVCGCNFEKRYGFAGKSKIHVHHLNQLSQVGTKHKVDPVLDMITVCANCHFIIHSRNEPYSIDEMKEMLISRE